MAKFPREPAATAGMLRVAALLGICVLIGATALNGTERLRMQVSPAVARAPALVTVRVTVEAAAENRFLQVVAESPTFYRSSEVPIDGRNASPLQVFEFRNLPTGLYQITGVLVGTQGPRATVARLAKVESAPGSR